MVVWRRTPAPLDVALDQLGPVAAAKNAADELVAMAEPEGNAKAALRQNLGVKTAVQPG
jgi:hypothetical protein